MMWTQRYLLFGVGLWPSALFAALPIFTLFFLLGVMRKAAWIAGLSGLAVTFLLAIFGYHMPAITAMSTAANGAAFGILPITWIVFWVIVLYRMTVDTGKFDIIRDSVGRLTDDPRLQALLIAFAFGAFLEGAAGFGTPVAIAAAMLTGLGFSPFRASAIALLSNTAPGAFGAIGIPVITLATTTDLPLGRLSTLVSRICSPVSLIMPAYVILAMGGTEGLSDIWLHALIAGVLFAVVQLSVSTYLGPQLTDILSALAAVAGLVLLFRFYHPKEHLSAAAFRGKDAQSDSMLSPPSSAPGSETALAKTPKELVPRPNLGVTLYAWLPYMILVVCVLLWGLKPVQVVFDRAGILFPWPFLHNVVQRMPPIVPVPSPYPAIFNINWLSAAGTACMIATLLSAVCLKMTPLGFLRLLAAVAHQLTRSAITIASVLGIAFLMNYCGATATLGLAFAATGKLFPFFSVLLGWLGVFLTGSDTSSNALFGSLQVVTSNRLGLDPILMSSANAVGGAMGKMISLQTIAVAAAATGMSVHDQSKLFRFTLKHSVVLVLIVSTVVLLLAYLSR
jgi:L-lactate transport